MRQIPIRRGTGDSRALDRAVDALKGGDAVAVFPEGRLSWGERVRARSGIGLLAGWVPNARIVLCTIEGTTDYVRFPKGPRVTVRFFAPAEGGTMPGEEAQAFSARLLRELRERVPVTPAGPLELIVTYGRDERADRSFAVLIEGRKVGEERIARRSPQEKAGFFDVAYSIPAECVLAGYMRLMSKPFIAAYPSRILNIHPALLPSFPGLHGQQDALEWGVRVSGCTVHLVDLELDHGPIVVVQRTVPVEDTDDVDTLSARILEQEDHAYPEALVKLLTQPWRLEGRRVVFGA